MYITLDQAKKALSRVLNAYNDENGNLDEDYLTSSINEVEAMINSSITNRYAIPVTSTSGIAFVVSLEYAILRYNAYSIIPNREVPKAVEGAYNSAISMLKSLSREQASVPGETEKTTGRVGYIKRSERSTITTGF